MLILMVHLKLLDCYAYIYYAISNTVHFYKLYKIYLGHIHQEDKMSWLTPLGLLTSCSFIFFNWLGHEVG